MVNVALARWPQIGRTKRRYRTCGRAKQGTSKKRERKPHFFLKPSAKNQRNLLCSTLSSIFCVRVEIMQILSNEHVIRNNNDNRDHLNLYGYRVIAFLLTARTPTPRKPRQDTWLRSQWHPCTFPMSIAPLKHALAHLAITLFWWSPHPGGRVREQSAKMLRVF